jgi:Archaeal IMP cyclohydrolase
MKPSDYLKAIKYPGRIVLSGTGPEGESINAYAITGRSHNSRNRIFVMEDGVLKTKAFDESQVSDPSLIIYPAILKAGKDLIVANGDQSLILEKAILEGTPLSKAIREYTYEPDGPNWTPRIAAVTDGDNGSSVFLIVRKNGEEAERVIWQYPKKNGYAHLIQTYLDDGNPLPSFDRDPVLLEVPGTKEELLEDLWAGLDEENRISLFVSYGEDWSIRNAREEAK